MIDTKILPEHERNHFFFRQDSALLEQVEREWEGRQALLNCQPRRVLQAIEEQAQLLVDGLLHQKTKVQFLLPHEISCPPADSSTPNSQLLLVPEQERLQEVGGLSYRLGHTSLLKKLCDRLAELEASESKALRIATALLRHTIVLHLLDMLLHERQSMEHEAANAEAGRFFLPQWAAFGERGQLLAESLRAAYAHIEALQEYVALLQIAFYLDSAVAADETFRQMRSGAVGQLTHHGRALARYETREIIDAIRKRAAANTLNRGFSLTLPYFDDQALLMKRREIEVIPPGRIPFDPAYVMWVAHDEQFKIMEEDTLNVSTRLNLLSQLRELELCFTVPTTLGDCHRPTPKPKGFQTRIAALVPGFSVATTNIIKRIRN